MFGEDVREEVYNALHINDWKSLMSNAEIKRILTEPTKEGLEKLINITNNSVFDRVMSILVSMKNSGTADISTRVVRTVEARADELRKGIRKTNIKIMLNKTDTAADSAELDSVKAENAKLQEQIVALQKQISESMNNSGTAEKAENETADKENSEESKKPGRPLKNK